MWSQILQLIGYILSVILIGCRAQRVARIGNELKASVSGVDIQGATFLMNDAVLSEGVVFAFSAFFRTDSAVRLQIWRPMDPRMNASRTFMMVSEIQVTPSVRFAREDVYIESRLTKPCTRVHTGDRIGIYIESSPGAVAYTFDPTQPTALAYTSESQTLTYGVNDYITFDTLTFPYDFSVLAYIDTNMSQYADPNDPFPDCPRLLLIPDYDLITLPITTPQPPPTGRPGDTGATGPNGQAGSTGQRGEQGPTGQMGVSGSTGQIGGTGATGNRGPIGATGLSGKEGMQGATGLAGPKGDHGDRGPIGPPGPPGDSNSSIFEPPLSPVEDSGVLKDPMFMLGILVWLMVVTLVILILIFCLLLAYKRRRDEDKSQWKHSLARKNNSFIFSTEKTPVYLSPPPDDTPSHDSWLASLKEETESHYSVDTISEYGKQNSQKHGRHHHRYNNNNNSITRAVADGNSIHSNVDSGNNSGSYGQVNHGADFAQEYSSILDRHHHGDSSSPYNSYEIPKHEITNY